MVQNNKHAELIQLILTDKAAYTMKGHRTVQIHKN